MEWEGLQKQMAIFCQHENLLAISQHFSFFLFLHHVPISVAQEFLSKSIIKY
jgi:hypothetical protein